MNPNIGTEIRRLRDLNKWSQAELADYSDVAIASLKQIELGNNNPTLATLFKLANALGTTPDKIIMPSWFKWKNTLNRK